MSKHHGFVWPLGPLVLVTWPRTLTGNKREASRMDAGDHAQEQKGKPKQPQTCFCLQRITGSHPHRVEPSTLLSSSSVAGESLYPENFCLHPFLSLPHESDAPFMGPNPLHTWLSCQASSIVDEVAAALLHHWSIIWKGWGKPGDCCCFGHQSHQPAEFTPASRGSCGQAVRQWAPLSTEETAGHWRLCQMAHGGQR